MECPIKGGKKGGWEGGRRGGREREREKECCISLLHILSYGSVLSSFYSCPVYRANPVICKTNQCMQYMFVLYNRVIVCVCL